MSSNQPIDLLRLSPAQATSIIASLDARAKAPGASRDRRRNPRIPYRQELMLLCGIHHGMDGATFFRVACVDVSLGGIGFLHGSFVHPGSACTVTLVTPTRKGFRAVGEVKRCFHVTRHVHFVGVKFNEDLKPGLVESLTQLEPVA